jgi:hypothetical protein
MALPEISVISGKCHIHKTHRSAIGSTWALGKKKKTRTNVYLKSKLCMSLDNVSTTFSSFSLPKKKQKEILSVLFFVNFVSQHVFFLLLLLFVVEKEQVIRRLYAVLN